jgi:threonine dehydrogenase-like Zn-dependent dehydrogenase
MKAFVMRRLGEVGFMDKPIPQDPGPNGAIVRTTRALVCTSDTHTAAGAIGERENLTLVHEAVGVVEKLGREVKSVKEGDRVAVNAITPCYKCENCLRGFTSQCQQMLGGWKFANVRDGVFASHFFVNDAEANLAPIPAGVPDEVAVYTTDMMSTGFAGAEDAAIPIGGSVAVFAVGPVGLMAIAGARLLGAGLVIAIESMPRRQELARHFGADVVLDYLKVDPIVEIMKLTKDGVDSAIEALGAEATFEACVKATRPGGTISNVGYHGHGDFVRIPREAWGVGMSDKTIRTALCPGGKERMKRLLRLIEMKRVDPSPLTTHRFSFDGIERAFNMMKTKEDGIIKPLISFA